MSACAVASPNDGTVAGALKTLTSSGPIEGRNLNVISLDAIRSNLGDRWPSKRDQVWGQVEKFLRHEFRAEDLVLRLDELNVLIVQPGRPRIAAQTRCVRAANDLIRFFLGDSVQAGASVRMVEAIVGDEVVCAPLPRSQLDTALLAQDPAPRTPVCGSKTPILTPLGRNLSLELALRPVLALQHGAKVVGYCARAALRDATNGCAIGQDERGQLQSSDLAAMDVQTLDIAFRRRSALPQPNATLIVPLSYAALAHSSTRYSVLQAVHRLSADERQGLIVEIVDLEAGAPASRIAELAAIARPHCRGVICRMALNVDNAEKLKSAGATLSVVPPRSDLSETALLKREGALAAVLKITPTVMCHALPADLASVAAFIGVTHCTLAPPQA